MSTATAIPPFYRHFFANFEPFLGLTGFWFNHGDPITFLTSLNPRYAGPPIAPETRMLLDTVTGFYAQNLFLQLALPRVRPHDLGIWRVWQGSLLVVDSVLTLAMFANMSRVGILGVGSWRWMEWVNVCGMLGLVGVRAAFVTGVGFGERATQGKKRA